MIIFAENMLICLACRDFFGPVEEVQLVHGMKERGSKLGLDEAC
jgi:hypothetical protein